MRELKFYTLLHDQHKGTSLRAMYCMEEAVLPNFIKADILSTAFVFKGVNWNRDTHCKEAFRMHTMIKANGITQKLTRATQVTLLQQLQEKKQINPRSTYLLQSQYGEDLGKLTALVIPVSKIPAPKGDAAEEFLKEFEGMEGLELSSEGQFVFNLSEQLKVTGRSHYQHVIAAAASTMQILHNGMLYSPCQLCQHTMAHVAGNCNLEDNNWCALALVLDSAQNAQPESDLE